MAEALSAEAAREIRQLEKSKEKSQRDGNAAEEAAACNRLGEILAEHGRFPEALEQHRQELRLLRGAGDALGTAVAHRKVGERLAELQRFPEALQHQQQHLQGALRLGSAVEQQRAWATIGRTFLLMAEAPPSSQIPEFPEFPQFPEFPEFPQFPESPEGAQGTPGNSGILGHWALRRALAAFQNSLDIVETQLEGQVPSRELQRMRARLFLNLGLAQESLGNLQESSRLLRHSAHVATQCHSLEDQFRAHFNLGLLQQRRRQFPESLRSLERARECARSLRPPRLLAEAEAAIGQVQLARGDFGAGRRALRRARALGIAHGAQGRHVRTCLRHASRVCRALAALSRCDPDVPSVSPMSPMSPMSLCERLGDSLARLGHFQRAAEFYQKQLELAEAAALPGRDLAVIHVSLATTFRDLGQHSRALEHFQRELELRNGEPLESCRTWLNVAAALEDSGAAPAQILNPLRNALGCARSAGDERLQRRVLRRLRAQQLRAGDPEGAEETQKELGGDPRGEEEEEDEDEDEDEDEEEEEESDSELSESDDEDEDLEGYPKSVPGRRRSNKWNRRNERGETPLHRACIEGDLKRVRLYLDQGHPVNPRDYCGWTPLHEAANHGHLEIARLLLARGAARDDAGGPGCEGLTPLHDALASGRFPVAQLLIRAGARLDARDAKGRTPLQTLQEWLRSFGPELDAETRQSARETLRLLREKGGKISGKQPENIGNLRIFG
nr:tonsoku-like protein [Taeniopygia guttata]